MSNLNNKKRKFSEIEEFNSLPTILPTISLNEIDEINKRNYYFNQYLNSYLPKQLPTITFEEIYYYLYNKFYII